MGERTCSIEGCPNKHWARGWCANHYARWYRKGSTDDLPTEAERFWAKVDKLGPVPEHRPDLGPCWLWTAAVYVRTGYGQFDGTTAHRWSWIAANGPIDLGTHVDHLCRVRLCVRVGHLEPVTPAENLRRGAGPGGVLHERPTHCPQGHPYDSSSGFTDKKGTRRCRICHKASVARYIAKRDAR